MKSIALGKARLRWEGRVARLVRGGTALEAALPAGTLGEEPLAKAGARAVLATRDTAVLADGKGMTLATARFPGAILAARAIGAAALLVGRDEVEVRDFPSGSRLGGASPGGASRPGLVAVAGTSAACAFADRFVAAAADGRTAVHAVQASFPLLEAVGGWFLAAGRDRIVTASAGEPGRSRAWTASGALRHDLFASKGALGALATRDHLYVVDGTAGEVRERGLGGRIEEVEVLAGRVRVVTADGREREFDAGGDEVG